MDELRRFSSLLEKIYAAAADPLNYAPIADEIAGYFGVGSAVVQTRDNATGNASLVSTTDNFSAKSLSEYGEHYYKVDEWVLRGSKINPGNVFQGSELIPVREFENSECYVDYGRHLGLYDCVAAVFPTMNGVCAFGVHRSKADREFDAITRAHMELLVPHLRNSLDLAGKLQEARRYSDTVALGLEQLDVAVILVDQNRRIRFLNKKAESFLEKREGLTARNSKLQAIEPKTDNRLLEAIQKAALEGVDGRLNIIKKDGAIPIAVRVLPAPSAAFGFLGQGRFAAVFLAVEGRNADPSSVLRDFFKLTPAEIRLAQALLAGHSLRSYSEERRISNETARTQMKSILSKTGTNRQSDLIILLNQNPLLRMG